MRRTYKEFIADVDYDHDKEEIDSFFFLVILFFVEASFLMNYLDGENNRRELYTFNTPHAPVSRPQYGEIDIDRACQTEASEETIY